MKQLGNIAVIAILVISIVSKLTAGNSILEGVQSNLTTASSTSISPWLKKAMNHHPRPRPPGCRSTPWICREGLHPPPARMRCCRHQCADVSSDVSNCGFCGKRCPFSWQCCRGLCVDTNCSPFNCGRCGNRCHRRVGCAYGMCGYALPFPIPPHPPSTAEDLD
ncbi:STIGMA-SPECIFIC STIG1-LIKE PROTEIN 4 [Salix purpurea]|uniref:STIGMA-SPECIFIC STIG1-LIKE PROTEIN 4 n=1 Tax=Salix purpurea TaxID=77065 RepID=A0A9Q0WNV0_SALPP|nr:STIGMA-SPECIFIC STIG1-LIKE PROTEIN 4 [Salix purpurea]